MFLPLYGNLMFYHYAFAILVMVAVMTVVMMAGRP